MPRRFRNFLNSRCNTRVELEHGVLPEGRPVKPHSNSHVPRTPVRPRSTSRYIPRLDGALKLLFDPRRELGLNPHDVYFPLGSNVVKNGDFSDFTMDDDASTVAHWIFDDIFDVENGGVGYVGQDWKGTTLGSNLVTNGGGSGTTDWVDSDGDGIPDEWAKFGGTNGYSEIVTEGNNRILRINNTSGSYSGIGKTVIPYTTGSVYLLVYKYRSTGQHGIELLSPGYYPFGVRVPPSGGVWKWFYGAFYATDNQRLTFQTWDLDTYVEIDEVELFEITAGNVLCRGANFWIEDQFQSGSPVYSGGEMLEFDKVNDYFFIPDAKATAFNPGTGNFTIEGRFIHPTVTDNHRIYSKHGTSGHAVIVRINSTGLLEFMVYDGTTWFTTQTTNRVDDSQPHYFAAVWDKTNNTMKLWVDGATVATADISTAGTIDVSGYELDIGRHHSGIQYFGGKLIELRYSNVARTDTEIWDSYGLARYWRFMDTPQPHNYNNSFIQRLNSPDTSAGANPSAYQTVNTRQNTLYLLRGFEKRIAGTANTHIFVYNATDGNMGTWPNDQTNIPNGVVLQKFFRPTVVTTDVYIRQHYTGDAIFDNIEIRPILSAKAPGTTVTNWADGIRSTITGSVNGSLETLQPKHPAAFEFDGVDDYLLWQNIVIGANDFLLFAWVKGQPAGGSGIMVGRASDTAGYAGWFWVIGYSSEQRFGFSNDGSNATNFYSSTAIADGNWHLAMVYGDIRNGVVTFFIDGRTDGNGTGLVAFTRESGNVTTGVSEWAGSLGSFFDGLIGVSGMFIGDFSQLDVEKLVQYIYDQTKIFYEV